MKARARLVHMTMKPSALFVKTVASYSHEKKCDGQKGNKTSTFTCRVCNQSFSSASDLVEHDRQSNHVVAGSFGNQKRPKCQALNRL